MLFSFVTLNAEDSYSLAVEAYRESDMDRALSLLESAVDEMPASDEPWLLKGIILQNKGRLKDAEEAMLYGRSLLGNMQPKLTLNLANLYVTMGEREKAVPLYGELLNGSLEAKARLNRANCYVTQKSYDKAVQDYKAYLQLDPYTDQKEEIEQMIALLQNEVDRQEELARQEAERARLEEEARLAAEREAAEEAARQQALLNDILSSLEDTGTDSEVFGAGSETIETETEESDILD